MGLEWSRDGRWLAFSAGGFFERRTREPAQIMIMRPDGIGRPSSHERAGQRWIPQLVSGWHRDRVSLLDEQ